jgi:hypothetical protein
MEAGHGFQSLKSMRFFREKQMASHNITVIFPAYNEEVPIDSVVLLARRYADRVIVLLTILMVNYPSLK